MSLRIVILGDATSINVRRWQQGLRESDALGSAPEVYLLSTHISQPLDAYTLPLRFLSLPRLPEKLRYFTAVPDARRLIAQLKPDLVLGYFVTGYGTLAALTGFHPLVQVTSGDDILISPQHPILGRLVRYNLRQADLIAAWAPHMAAAAQALGIGAEKIFTLPRGIPLDQFDLPTSAQSAVGELDRPLRLISTRSLYPPYRIDALLRALKLLRDSGLEVGLTVAGEGPERMALETLADELNLTACVKFVGMIPNDELGKVLAQHDVYVSVVESDGVSASLLEAMAVGLFPVVYDNVPNRYWIDSGENGLLLSDNAPETIAGAVRQAVANPLLRQRAAVTNRQIVRERGDLRHNANVYLERFAALAAYRGNAGV